MSILGVESFGALPMHCLTICYCFFVITIVINLIRDHLPKKVSKLCISLPMAMAILFYRDAEWKIETYEEINISFLHICIHTP